MKKRSFYSSINISLLIILFVYIIQIVILLYQFNSNHPIEQIINDSKNIMFSFLLLIIILYIGVMIYQPIKMRRSIKQLKHVFDEFRKGNYEYDLDNLTETIEKEYSPLVESIKKMMSNIIQFDKLKEVKISAHYSKLKTLLSLVNDGAMIIDKSGELLYINEVMLNIFKNLNLEENNDILDTVFPDYFEKTIKKYIHQVLVKKEKDEPCSMYIPELNLEFTIKSALYKNRNGDFLGAVFILTKFEENSESEYNENKLNDNKGE